MRPARPLPARPGAGPAVRALMLVLALAGPGAAQQPEGDLATLSAAAEAGDVQAQMALAQRYQDGRDVLRSYARAAAWYARAAEAGNAEAQNRLGRHYQAGLGVPVDPALALRWLGAAAAQGAPQHMVDYAAVLEQDRENPEALARAAALYERAAAQGHVQAAVSLGVMLQEGLGVPQDHDRARALYEAAAEAGDARAQNNLGLLHVRGHGVPQDYGRAAALFAAAAEQGLPQALTNLGVMYENGFGVPQDDAEAARLYRLGGAGARDEDGPGLIYDARLAPPPVAVAALEALRADARAGDPVAQFVLAWMLSHRSDPQPGDRRAAAALFAAAAAAGHATSMANLGLLYAEGRGVPQDFVLAQMWLTLAATAGLEAALPHSAALQGRMTPAQINEAQTMAETRWQAR